MTHTLSITVIERAAKDGQWRFERATLQSPEKAIRSWLQKAAESAPVYHGLSRDTYEPETRSRPPIRAWQCLVVLPEHQQQSLWMRLLLAIFQVLTDTLRILMFRPRRPVHAKFYPSRFRKR